MGYPVILNGDHAEFEAEHVNTNPEDRPDWPLPSFDAQDWAKAFCKIANGFGFKDAKGEPIDEGWMLTWFAGALMRGFDEHVARHGKCPAMPRSDEDQKALKAVEEWWLLEGMKHFNGAPYAIFAVRAALAAASRS